MIRRSSLSRVAVFCVFLITLSPLSAGDGKQPSKSTLIVHEWGTFTSFAGSDGVNLEFRPLVSSDLPGFVYSPGSLLPFTKRSIYARQRMETPVTYFYSDVERDVNVSVTFRQGMLTEFYPPPAGFHSKRSEDQSKVLEERIDWGKVHIIPHKSLVTHVANPDVADRVNRHVAMGLVPWFDEENPYYRARETDSALLYVRRKPDESMLSSLSAFDFRGDHFEKFLFYRGAGQIDLPLKAVAIDDNQVHIENPTQQPIRGGLVVHYNGENLRFAVIGTVHPGEKALAKLPGFDAASKPDQYQALDRQLVSQLMAEGLYEKEARAMVNTWRDSWYREIGLRVFFFLPPTQTDEILPLTIDPKPDQVVRVLVARTELMTPSEERQIVSLIDRSSGDDSAIEELVKDLSPRGRLAEPALRRCAAMSKAANVKELLEQVLPMLAAAVRG